MYIQQYIAQNTQSSRRYAENLLKQGLIRINDKKAEPGQKIDPKNDKIKYFDTNCSTLVDKSNSVGRWITIENNNEKLVYYAINKPKGYVCTVSDKYAEKKIIDLVPKKPKVHPVGRLDKNSEGLIFLTNDGDFTYKLTHPKFKIEKEYSVQVIKKSTWLKINLVEIKTALLKGVKLSDGLAKVDVIHNFHKLSTSKISLNLALHSGKKRIIRRMFKKIGWHVEKLERICIGSIKLDIPRGAFRKLTKNEVKLFR